MQIEAQGVPDSRRIGLSESHHLSGEVSLGSGEWQKPVGHKEAGPDDDDIQSLHESEILRSILPHTAIYNSK